MLFEELVKQYLHDKQYGRKPIRLNTLEGYASCIHLHLMPRWGGREVESITYEEAQAWLDGIERGAAKCQKTLRQVLRWGIAHRKVVMADPTIGLEAREPERREAVVLSSARLNQLLYKCKGEPWEAVVWCQACLGLRRCEAVALTWGDIDLRSGQVRVTKGRHVVGGKVFVWGTKTEKSKRTLVLPRFAVMRLREIRKALRATADELLCDLRPDAISRRFRSWCRRNGFAGFTLMQLRHTWATIAVRAGIAIEVVAMNLGHAGIEMAYRRYIARSVDVLKAAQRKWGELLLKSAPPERLDLPLGPALVA